MIKLDNISLKYYSFEKDIGLIGTIKDLFNRKLITVVALDKINLKIYDGELIGLIGPNGAGKTTLTKILTGILKPSSGTALIDNVDPNLHNKQLLQQIGVLFGQKSQLSWDLPAIDTLNMLSHIYNIDSQKYHRRLNQLANMLKTEDILKIPVRKLSLGQRVKCDLMCSLIHSPKYLFLDEPTLGLDLVTQESIYEFLREENNQNKTTIILTSHNIRDIQAVSKRLIILAKGKKIFDDLIDNLPVNLEAHNKFVVKSYSSNFKSQITKRIDEEYLSQYLKDLDSKKIISIYREGISLEDLILEIYKNE
ncbi:ATP-binding cassette domain-containing protein [Lactobacillus mulieris]|uniref:ABC transporter ATP-binding protein n=1 Tax=Lactobacillus mulieris TaxID=2508708 RepID=UPI001432B207|nr:ATP-binding cassette domain-containing protein [Lactobacillus mulieris]MCF1783298.1 ATP-binding cassette domain-containing protein [Lactobacillus mulieris]MCW8104500.1 ATP-binding cassette domain-containing protein [Lactobacillus mulieris]MDK6802943.1 ATP-binding cassette domain-containing protein [Lactobacillus mulieris]MDK8382059.1 ATP-binding cassette domain-containing protein [Lactobacillus mulieris]MDT9620275.1 ATP-binding cassette domain-containing protein [Lactobacillus mulieris]